MVTVEEAFSQANASTQVPGRQVRHLRLQKNFPERVLTQHLYLLLMTWKEIRDFKILGHLINSTPPSAPSM